MSPRRAWVLASMWKFFVGWFVCCYFSHFTPYMFFFFLCCLKFKKEVKKSLLSLLFFFGQEPSQMFFFSAFIRDEIRFIFFILNANNNNNNNLNTRKKTDRIQIEVFFILVFLIFVVECCWYFWNRARPNEHWPDTFDKCNRWTLVACLAMKLI